MEVRFVAAIGHHSLQPIFRLTRSYILDICIKMYLSIYLFKIAKQNERPGNENSNEAWCFHGNRGAKVLKNMADLGDV